MTQALATKQQSLLAQTAQELQITPSYLQTIKNTFAKDATDNELSLFLRTAKRIGLDISARQLFMVKRYDSSIKDYAMSIQISIDGFRLIADRTNKYAPSREPSYAYDEKGHLVSATAYVKKLVGGQWHEIAATAFYSEYVQTTKENKPNMIWAKMPRLMLAKCAESLVLRRAFPAELSGLYTSDEMGNPEVSDIKPQVATDYQQPEPPPENPLDVELKNLCSSLNESGDSIIWKPKSLAEYSSELFDAEIENAFSLDDEQKQILVDDLKQRLAENQAIANEAVEAEIVE